MELGIVAPKCNCLHACEKGVEPMSDCICKLPGETVTAFCDICDPTHQRFTWHNNGSCISCVRNAREAQKAAKLSRFNKEPILEDAIELPEDALRDSSEVEQAPVKRQVVGSIPTPAAMSIILRFGQSEIVLATEQDKIERMIQALK